jgi:AcrR family transcriptional regulator
MTEKSTSKKGQPNKADAVDRVAQILSHAEHVFALRGYEGASMRDIAAACGISKALLFYHFDSKDEIYRQVAARTVDELYLFVRDRVQPGSPSARIRAFMVATAEYFDRRRWAWIAATAGFWNDPDRHRQKEQLARRDRYEHFLRSLIEEAIEAGEIRKVDVPMTGRLLLSSLNWMHRWYKPNKSLTPEQIADMYFDLVFNGLRTGEIALQATASPLKPARLKPRRATLDHGPS